MDMKRFEKEIVLGYKCENGHYFLRADFWDDYKMEVVRSFIGGGEKSEIVYKENFDVEIGNELINDDDKLFNILENYLKNINN